MPVEKTKIKREIRDRWADALVSGQYKQGDGYLRRRVVIDTDTGATQDEFCCLGVLCELAVADGIIPAPVFYPEAEAARSETEQPLDGYYFYPHHGDLDPSMGAIGSLPREVVAWAGLDSEDPALRVVSVPDGVEAHDASTLNDSYKLEFSEIANYVRALNTVEEESREDQA